MNGDSSIDINTFGSYVEGIDDIAQSWYIILHTIPGSDPLRPNFGSDIYQYLDKPNNSFGGDFAAQIIKDLEKWETRCTISQVKPSVGDDNNIKVNIIGVYIPTNTVVSATLTLAELTNTDLTTKMASYSEDYNDKQYN
jgi:phage baseplate assembly protein W